MTLIFQFFFFKMSTLIGYFNADTFFYQPLKLIVWKLLIAWKNSQQQNRYKKISNY